jgi:drug/metabolite transporter (DMT)-like permease
MRLLDLALLLMVVIWGANFSVIKLALREFPQVTFNALRLSLASVVFLVIIARHHRIERRLTRAEWLRVFLLAVVGYWLYQLVFVAGLARTSASNGSLIFGTTPITIALFASLAGHERIAPIRWAGAALSLLGIYIVVGERASVSTSTLLGDGLMFCATVCWAIYSVASQPLLKHHSPILITGYAMVIGAVLYGALAVPTIVHTDWRAISLFSWVLMTLSSLLALALSYIIWYTGVQRIGSARTAVYSNLTPVVAMLVAAVWLNEPIGVRQVIGAAAILGGVFVTRFAPQPGS